MADVTNTPQPQQTDTVTKTIDGIKIVIENGGIKGTLVKVLLWTLIPLVILLIIGYFLYSSYFTRKSNIDTGRGQNNSVRYTDDNTDWNVQVIDINNNAREDELKKFEQVVNKVKELYK